MLSNAIMWILLRRPPLPDAPYWPGRRAVSLLDAVAWPAAWATLATQLQQSVGIVGPMIIALAALLGVRRAHRAVLHNHSYHFTTLRCGRAIATLLLLGTVIWMTTAS